MLFPVGSFPGAPQLETKKALLLIDLQNDFIHPTGSLAVPNVADFLPRLPGLVAKFRETGDIVWIQTHFVEPRPTISPDLGGYTIVLKDVVAATAEDDFAEDDAPWYDDAPLENDAGAEDPEAFLAPRKPEKCVIARSCLAGTAGARLAESLAASVDHDKDVVLVKSHYSAFVHTAFLLNLRQNLIRDLYLCGSLSNISVYATALDAVRHGLRVTIVEDCVGYRDEACHLEAMRQMADAMGAEGVELQELVDDLNGDLGDVVTEATFPTRYEVSLADAKRRPEKPRLSPRVQQWMSGVDSLSSTNGHSLVESIELLPDNAEGPPSPLLRPPSAGDGGAMASTRAEHASGLSTEAPGPTTAVRREGMPASPSPPRKRSTDIDFEQQEPKAMYASSRRRLSEEPAVPASKPPTPKMSRIRVRRRKPKDDAAVSGASDPLVASAPSSRSEGRLSRGVRSAHPSISDRGNVDPPPVTAPCPAPAQSRPPCNAGDDAGSETRSIDRGTLAASTPGARASSVGASPVDAPASLVPEPEHRGSPGPATLSFGAGDSRLCLDLLPPPHATQAFHTLRWTAKWQKMYHRAGEVPRLVAVQGEVQPDRAIPIYRHPADESPPLLPFSPAVQKLRELVEQVVHHPVNHVLIQLYRSGDDNISEHSDKTLDIVRGSAIVNLSLGAQRTMVLRAKKAGGAASAETGQPRLAQRIPLPHNSLFILGPQTNQLWLHAIRADKRRLEEKSTAEVDFGGERISLTFRHVGTFIDPIQGTIWGQGAGAKDRKAAATILSGAEAERAGERMIRAFGQENHQSHDFNWETLYGDGFDVVNFATPEVPDGGAP